VREERRGRERPYFLSGKMGMNSLSFLAYETTFPGVRSTPEGLSSSQELFFSLKERRSRPPREKIERKIARKRPTSRKALLAKRGSPLGGKTLA